MQFIELQAQMADRIFEPAGSVSVQKDHRQDWYNQGNQSRGGHQPSQFIVPAPLDDKDPVQVFCSQSI